MLGIVIAYHKNDNPESYCKFIEMLESLKFSGYEKDIYITLDGADPSYIKPILEKYNIPVDNVIFSLVNVGNYALKFMLMDKIKLKYRFIKFCDFDDRSCSMKKLLDICEMYKTYKLICCRCSKWSMFTNYWDKLFSSELLLAIPRFKCFTGGDVIIMWMSFYLCFKNNWQFAMSGDMIYYKSKIASKTCRESEPEQYLKLETDSEEIKNILFYCEVIESKHIYEHDQNILNIDFMALKQTISLNDFICRMPIHYKF